MIRVNIKLVSYFDVSYLSDRIICFDEDEWILKLDELVMIIFIFIIR